MIVNIEELSTRLKIDRRAIVRRLKTGEMRSHSFAVRRTIYPYWYEPEVQTMESGGKVTERDEKSNLSRWGIVTLSDIALRTSLPVRVVNLIVSQCKFPSHKLISGAHETTVYLEKEIDWAAFDAEVPGTGKRKANAPFGSRPEDAFLVKAKDGRYKFPYKLKTGRRCQMLFPNHKTPVDPLRDSTYLAKARYEVRKRTGIGKPAWKTTNKMKFPNRKQRIGKGGDNATV